MTASAGVVRYPAEAFAKGGNSNECKRLIITAHFSHIMIPQKKNYFYCQLSLFIGDISHNLIYDYLFVHLQLDFLN